MFGLTPHLGVAFLAPAFFAVLIGRPGSLAGPLFGAFVVALLSNSLRGLFSETTATPVLRRIDRLDRHPAARPRLEETAVDRSNRRASA